ncbi:MAG: mechanosensitive ion channel [Cyanothece sp. SIO2G6]|nr:mechanosensitive ion channel [Cyanothece sp. SIO2G6]
MQIDQEILADVRELVVRLGLFFTSVVIAPFFGRQLPRIFFAVLRLFEGFSSINAEDIYAQFIEPLKNSLTFIGTFSFSVVCLNLIITDTDLYRILGVFIYSALSVSIVWFASKIARKIIRQFIIGLVQRWFGQVNEVVLIFETLSYVLIILVAIIIFAVGLDFNLATLLTSLGVVGAGLAFAAQQTLSRLFGTLELYLDRPYVSGEYIRVNFNPHAEDIYGRVESVGLRSTKIRVVAQNTMMVVPNSLMAGINIENVSRGKKIMALLCLDFIRQLKSGEQALVQQIVEDTSVVFWGLDKANVQIQFCLSENGSGTRARIIFFLTSSSGNSLELRKRLLELANDAIAQQLATYNLRVMIPEPTVYIDSRMSI